MNLNNFSRAQLLRGETKSELHNQKILTENPIIKNRKS